MTLDMEPDHDEHAECRREIQELQDRVFEAAADNGTLNGRIRELDAKVERLRERLRGQTAQTQETAEQVRNAVLETLKQKGVLPQGLAHPIEQIVGTCIATLQCEVEQAVAGQVRAVTVVEHTGKGGRVKDFGS